MRVHLDTNLPDPWLAAQVSCFSLTYHALKHRRPSPPLSPHPHPLHPRVYQAEVSVVVASAALAALLPPRARGACSLCGSSG